MTGNDVSGESTGAAGPLCVSCLSHLCIRRGRPAVGASSIEDVTEVHRAASHKQCIVGTPAARERGVLRHRRGV